MTLFIRARTIGAPTRFLIVQPKDDDMEDPGKEFIETRGVVEELLPAAKFRIRLPNDQLIVGHLSGKMRIHRIRLLPGDTVRIELSPYDLTKGRIVYRI